MLCLLVVAALASAAGQAHAHHRRATPGLALAIQKGMVKEQSFWGARYPHKKLAFRHIMRLEQEAAAVVLLEVLVGQTS
jgi:hypothetical protein